jgi:oligosaccharide repeat unit polymerase
MHWVDLAFAATCAAYFAAVVGVLHALRREPLYEPRVLFTLAASLWLLIIPGYLVEFEGYLAAKPGFYQTDVRLLSVFALGMMLVGYCALIGGATLAARIRTRQLRNPFRANTLLLAVCLAFVAVAVANFTANVFLVSGGNLFAYMANFAMRPYEIADDLGISAAGYLLGFIAVQLLAYQVGRRRPTALVLFGLLTLVLVTTVMRTSQGRLFQVLVFVGACYVAYAMGASRRNEADVAWPRRLPYLLSMAALGIGLYFLRLASALKNLGLTVDLGTVSTFFNQIVHFSLERGNVPNFPVVFTIIEKVPGDQDFLLGKTLFNWALFLIPKSILKGDYLISIWIKDTWYFDIEGGGLPPTAVGEWYANFGIAGVIGGMFLVGFLLGRIFKLARLSDNPFLAVLWANLAFGFIVIYPKTDLAQIPAFTMVILLFTWLLVDLLRAGARGARA